MHPILFAWGPLTVLTHDAFTVVALALGLAIYYRELSVRGMLGGPIVWISLAAVLGGAIGARLITSWEHVEVYDGLDVRPFTEVIEHSGKSILGAIAGGWIAIALTKRAFGYTRSTGDCYLLAIPIATVVGRIGCFFSELPLGTPTTLPWGISVSPDAAAAFASLPRLRPARCIPRCCTRSPSTSSRSSSSSGTATGSPCLAMRSSSTSWRPGSSASWSSSCGAMSRRRSG